MRPIDVIATRFEIVHGSPPKMRARCPAHRTKGGSVAIRETLDGKVLIHCFAGCTLHEILNAANLSEHELFPGDESLRQREHEWAAARRRFAKAPKDTLHATINQEIARIRARVRVEFGFDPPFRSVHFNEALGAAGRILGKALAPIAAHPWESAAHDWHPEWPALFELAVTEERRRTWRALNPDSNFRDMPQALPTLYERLRAEERAARWMHARINSSAR